MNLKSLQDGISEKFKIQKKRYKMTAQEMHIELKEFVQSEEIDNNDILQVSTIHNWIGRYSREFYHEGTLIALEIFNANGFSSNGEL
ncbi:5725_t:CDS:2 [Cetraspora pellucida]|uniref:5725_t:CDS:1 n=1 Tax=Cetraspora pellucida TaxID=1433469 RepID=A0A9N9CAR2_9GLOM|nr:5725_t:CDS:2 [Cetraspora pellucida]